MDWRKILGGSPAWYDITALLDMDIVASASGVRVRRKDDQIQYSFSALRLHSVGIILPWASLPIGYRPTWNQQGHLGITTGDMAEVTVNTGGGLVVNGGQAGQTYRGNFTVWTAAQQPTSHPGTEVA